MCKDGMSWPLTCPVDMIIKCEWKYPAVQLKIFLVKGIRPQIKTNSETKIFYFSCFLALRTETSCTHPKYYPKYEVWAIEFFCGRIPFKLHMDPMCKNGMSWALTCRRILSWILPRRDNTSPCRKHKLTWMENTTGTIKRLIVYRELLPFLPIWPELRYGIHFDIYFVKFMIKHYLL